MTHPFNTVGGNRFDFAESIYGKKAITETQPLDAATGRIGADVANSMTPGQNPSTTRLLGAPWQQSNWPSSEMRGNARKESCCQLPLPASNPPVTTAPCATT